MIGTYYRLSLTDEDVGTDKSATRSQLKRLRAGQLV